MPFNVDRAAQPKKGTKRPFPHAAAILIGGVRRYVTPSPTVAEKLGGKVPLIGVDIETHDWTDGAVKKKGTIGQFGCYNICEPCDIDAPRIAQPICTMRGSSMSHGLQML